jgi:hypothetical protein
MPSAFQGIQFRGKNALLRAYENSHIIAWSVCYGKNLVMKYVGTDENEAREALKIFLDQLEASDTTATYTLRLYEDLPKGAKIKFSTEPDYAFNFIVTEDEAPRYARRENTEVTALRETVARLEAKIQMDEEDGDDEEDDKSIGGILNGILSDPKIKEWIQTKAIGFADRLLSPPPPAPANIIDMNTQAQKIGSVTNDSPVLINEDQQKKCADALDILARCDANLGDNLMKIAKIAENDPGKYSMFSKLL